jgi:Zn-dependent peptidase ImmA (M78 family)
MAAGERFADDFGLVPVPAARLAEVMEYKLGVLVLMVDAINGVSGAACRLPELDAVLINRHEVPGRRNFDLAHELFHILTWDAMPPEHVEEASEQSKSRVEQLANNFASALLMPAAVLDRLFSSLTTGSRLWRARWQALEPACARLTRCTFWDSAFNAGAPRRAGKPPSCCRRKRNSG